MIINSPANLYVSNDEMTLLKKGNLVELTFNGIPDQDITLDKLLHYQFTDGDYKNKMYRKLLNRVYKDNVVIETYAFSLKGLEKSGFIVKLMSDLKTL